MNNYNKYIFKGFLDEVEKQAGWLNLLKPIIGWGAKYKKIGTMGRILQRFSPEESIIKAVTPEVSRLAGASTRTPIQFGKAVVSNAAENLKNLAEHPIRTLKADIRGLSYRPNEINPVTKEVITGQKRTFNLGDKLGRKDWVGAGGRFFDLGPLGFVGWGTAPPAVMGMLTQGKPLPPDLSPQSFVKGHIPFMLSPGLTIGAQVPSLFKTIF